MLKEIIAGVIVLIVGALITQPLTKFFHGHDEIVPIPKEKAQRSLIERFSPIEDNQPSDNGITPPVKVPDPPECAHELSKTSDVKDFFVMLENYNKLRQLSYGNRSDFGTGAGCYVAIANPQRIADVLYYDGMTYQSCRNNERFTNLGKYRGMRAVWFKPL